MLSFTRRQTKESIITSAVEIAGGGPLLRADLDERWNRALDMIDERDDGRSRRGRRWLLRFFVDASVLVLAVAIGSFVDKHWRVEWHPYDLDVDNLGAIAAAVAIALIWREWLGPMLSGDAGAARRAPAPSARQARRDAR